MFQQVYWDDFDIQTFLDVFGLEAEHSIEMQLLGWENGVLEWKEHGINLKQRFELWELPYLIMHLNFAD